MMIPERTCRRSKARETDSVPLSMPGRSIPPPTAGYGEVRGEDILLPKPLAPVMMKNFQLKNVKCKTFEVDS